MKVSVIQWILNYLSKHPEAAGEQFKILLAQLQQLAHSVDHERLNQYLSDKKHATDFQMETWEYIAKQTKKESISKRRNYNFIIYKSIDLFFPFGSILLFSGNLDLK